MPLNSAIVGTSGDFLVHEIDARWTMAYAAGLGDMLPCYVETRRPEDIVAHPLFPVCFEWPALVALHEQDTHATLTPDERVRGVHATHDHVLHRLVRPGDSLITRATVAGIERRTPGAYRVVRLDTTDASGAPVCTMWYGTLFLDVEVEGPDRSPTDAPTPLQPIATGAEVRAEVTVPIAANAAHVYTECARIWNPIHTDAAVAAQAGLPGLILHGTATLALAVSQIVAIETQNQPRRVQRVSARFGAMVLMPSTLTVRILARTTTSQGDIVQFEVRNAEGAAAVRDGYIVLR